MNTAGTEPNAPPELLNGMSADELAAVVRLAYFLWMSRSDPDRLQTCLEVLQPFLDALERDKRE